MRTASPLTRWALLGLLAVPAAAPAQHRPRSDDIARDYNDKIGTITDEIDALRKKLDDPGLSMAEAARLVEQQSALRRRADDLWSATDAAIGKSFRDARDAITDYNDRNRRLDFESAVVGSKVDVLNNVAKYPTKDDFDKNKSTMSESWDRTYGSRLKPFGEEFARQKEEIFKAVKEKYGIDLEAEGYARIGTSNPYTGEVYYRYYDKNGKALYVQWENDADGLRKYQEDVEAYRRRRRDEQEQLKKDATGLTRLDDQFRKSQEAVGGRLKGLEGQARKVNFVGTWSGGDNTGNRNTVGLTLNAGGELTYSWSRSNASYSGRGTWEQNGKVITARTNDGKYQLRSRITEDYRLEFNVTEDGRSFQVFLNR